MARQMTQHDLTAARLTAIVESSDDAIIGKTLDGIITSWNRAAERIFGYTAAEMIGQSITRLIPEERHAEEEEVLARLRRGERIDHFQTVRLARGGRKVDVLVTVSPIKDDQGRIVGAAKIARDVTERNWTGATLVQSERHARAILEAVSEAILLINEAGAIVSLNRRAEEMFGYARESLLGRPLEMLLPERLRATHAGHRAAYFQDPHVRPMGQGLDLLARRKDGTEFPVEISLSYVRSDEGVQALAFVTEITQRRAMERATRQAERLAALGRLSAGIAHEVNNPIGIILSRIEIMLLDAQAQPLPGKVADDLRVLHRHAQRVAGIAHGLLSFARESSGTRRPVDLNDVVEETLLLVEKEARAAGIAIRRALAPDVPPVLADGSALQQVLLNLITNAREALGPGGEITLETTAVADRPGAARLVVRDTGAGIPPDVLPKIFDPFFTTKSEGTGLGLSISYGIVREHNATIDVESRPGEGTTFVLMFPSMGEDLRP
jgi:two-component system cell cycle sensor histidine kinase/response regulator CckA